MCIPNYKKIYSDILDQRFPEKKEECFHLLEKANLSALDVIKINTKIFGKTENDSRDVNQKHRSYSSSSILEILDYQKKHKLNNSELALHFKLSKNSITKWKKNFL